MSTNKKRKFECLQQNMTDNDKHKNLYSEPPKKKQCIKKQFEHSSDEKKFDIIYNTLKQMNNLKSTPEEILKEIAIYSTGEIKLCDYCKKTENHIII